MKAKIEIFQSQENINNEIKKEYFFENVSDIWEDSCNQFLLSVHSKYSGEGSFIIQRVFVFWISLENCRSIPFVISDCFLKKKSILKNHLSINLNIDIDLNDEYIFIYKNLILFLIKKSDYPKELLNGIFVD